MINIVLIDDDPISTFITEKLIFKNIKIPYNIFKFTNAIDALKEMDCIRPDYLFLDLNMPEMSGWDFLEQFNYTKNNPEIYILTSSVDERDIKRASRYSQVKRYLSKPLINQSIKDIFTNNRSN
ncbi:MAG TPA: response regulator [Cyclobacteriaceae bacterium]|nr:response regulator [Cyclobacteriaceae bacterium]